MEVTGPDLTSSVILMQQNESPTVAEKPKQLSNLEKQLVTNMTEKITTPLKPDGLENVSTSRYGRARKPKTHTNFLQTEKAVNNALKTSNDKSPTKSPTVYKMNASNSPVKLVKSPIEAHIETLMQKNRSLSRFSDKASTTLFSPIEKQKIYVRKDLIQRREDSRDETVSLIKNMFSPEKNVFKSPNTKVFYNKTSAEKLNMSKRSAEKHSSTKFLAEKRDISKRSDHLNMQKPLTEKCSKSEHRIDNSSVVKTLNFDGDSSNQTKIVEKSTEITAKEMETNCTYEVGDLTWGRVGTYPFWPCIITRDPISGTFVKTRSLGRGVVRADVVHVSFFGDNGRRGWIIEGLMRPFQGLKEFEEARNKFSLEMKKKDSKLYAAFQISEKKNKKWKIAVDEAEIMLNKPKELRFDLFLEILGQPSPSRKTNESKRNSECTRISLSESLFDTLFSEDDTSENKERSRKRSLTKTLDVSDVVTACLDDIVTKTGNSKIQRQSHMDRWLQKAKSKTPEKNKIDRNKFRKSSLDVIPKIRSDFDKFLTSSDESVSSEKILKQKKLKTNKIYTKQLVSENENDYKNNLNDVTMALNTDSNVNLTLKPDQNGVKEKSNDSLDVEELLQGNVIVTKNNLKVPNLEKMESSANNNNVIYQKKDIIPEVNPINKEINYITSLKKSDKKISLETTNPTQKITEELQKAESFEQAFVDSIRKPIFEPKKRKPKIYELVFPDSVTDNKLKHEINNRVDPKFSKNTNAQRRSRVIENVTIEIKNLTGVDGTNKKRKRKKKDFIQQSTNVELNRNLKITTEANNSVISDQNTDKTVVESPNTDKNNVNIDVKSTIENINLYKNIINDESFLQNESNIQFINTKNGKNSSSDVSTNLIVDGNESKIEITLLKDNVKKNTASGKKRSAVNFTTVNNLTNESISDNIEPENCLNDTKIVHTIKAAEINAPSEICNKKEDNCEIIKEVVDKKSSKQDNVAASKTEVNDASSKAKDDTVAKEVPRVLKQNPDGNVFSTEIYEFKSKDEANTVNNTKQNASDIIAYNIKPTVGAFAEAEIISKNEIMTNKMVNLKTSNTAQNDLTSNKQDIFLVEEEVLTTEEACSKVENSPLESPITAKMITLVTPSTSKVDKVIKNNSKHDTFHKAELEEHTVALKNEVISLEKAKLKPKAENSKSKDFISKSKDDSFVQFKIKQRSTESHCKKTKKSMSEKNEKPSEQTGTKMKSVHKFENPKFKKYLERKIDNIMDENPELSHEDIVSYIYKIWIYENDIKTRDTGCCESTESNKVDDVLEVSDDEIDTDVCKTEVTKAKFDTITKNEVLPEPKTKVKNPDFNTQAIDKMISEPSNTIICTKFTTKEVDHKNIDSSKNHDAIIIHSDDSKNNFNKTCVKSDVINKNKAETKDFTKGINLDSGSEEILLSNDNFTNNSKLQHETHAKFDCKIKTNSNESTIAQGNALVASNKSKYSNKYSETSVVNKIKNENYNSKSIGNEKSTLPIVTNKTNTSDSINEDQAVDNLPSKQNNNGRISPIDYKELLIKQSLEKLVKTNALNVSLNDTLQNEKPNAICNVSNGNDLKTEAKGHKIFNEVIKKKNQNAKRIPENISLNFMNKHELSNGSIEFYNKHSNETQSNSDKSHNNTVKITSETYLNTKTIEKAINLEAVTSTPKLKILTNNHPENENSSNTTKNKITTPSRLSLKKNYSKKEDLTPTNKKASLDKDEDVQSVISSIDDFLNEFDVTKEQNLKTLLETNHKNLELSPDIKNPKSKTLNNIFSEALATDGINSLDKTDIIQNKFISQAKKNYENESCDVTDSGKSIENPVGSDSTKENCVKNDKSKNLFIVNDENVTDECTQIKGSLNLDGISSKVTDNIVAVKNKDPQSNDDEREDVEENTIKMELETTSKQKRTLRSTIERTERKTLTPDSVSTASNTPCDSPINLPSENKKIHKYDHPGFLKHVESNQDTIMDENLHLTEDEIIKYLYKTWLYEENLKSEEVKNDEKHQSNLVKGLDYETQPKKVKKRAQTENNNDRKELHSTVQEKPLRKRTVATYFDYDTESDGEVDPTKINKEKEEDNKANDNTENDCGVKDTEIAEEDFYLAQLTTPKPNLFKGLAKERICEICEKPTNLLKCKGLCGDYYHSECVKNYIEPVMDDKKTRKRKKKAGRPKKILSQDDSKELCTDSDSQIDERSQDNIDTDIDIKPIVSMDDFENLMSSKMKELIENTQPIFEIDLYSTEDELDWTNMEAGTCEIVGINLKPKVIEQTNFKCHNCEKYDKPLCFVCKSLMSPKSKTMERQKCNQQHCYKYYHIDCLDQWPQTQLHTNSSQSMGSMTCPRHVCHTCVCDDPRGCKTRFSAEKLARCIKCPAVYHSFTKCLPAGSKILTGSLIICPRHSEQKTIKPGRHIPFHVNTSWCFICATGGSLICCEYCPTSFHADCLNIKPPEDGYMCEDCETGRLPLYGEMVWVKLGNYRWWPGIILHPIDIPKNVATLKHAQGEFVVRFFGQNDHYWVNRGRVFPYQEGDTGKVTSQRSKLDTAFLLAVEHAVKAHNILKEAKENPEETLDIESSLLPPQYVKLKVNKPCGSLVNRRLDTSEDGSLTQCDCDPHVEEPCGPDSHCLNRMLLTECGTRCRAGDRCCNRRFEKRQYPKLTPYRTPQRGWGLRTLEDIMKGDFVIEYVGELIDEEEFRFRMKRKHETRDENYYFLTLDKDRMIDAGPKGNVARFMNHSCEPNCETQKWTVLGDVRVGLFALRDIPANSEVTFNYNLECAGIEKKPCMCGTSRCSGYIGAKPKQLDTNPKKHKKDPNVKRKYTKKTLLPIMNKVKPRKPRPPPKPRELTEIEKDLLIIQSATNMSSSDSEEKDPKILRINVERYDLDNYNNISDTDSLSNISKDNDSLKAKASKALKRKRVSFSGEEIIFFDEDFQQDSKKVKSEEIKRGRGRPRKNPVVNGDL